MKNKVLLVFCLTLTVCFVSGCSLKNSFKEKVTSDIEQKSGISMDKTYREYRTNVLKGNVKNSYYFSKDTPVIPDDSREMVPENQVRISFAQNSLLDVHYYTDKSKTNEIISPYDDFIYLNPGDRIYAEVNTNNNRQPGVFSFREFCIYEYSENGRFLFSSSLPEEDGLVFTVPENGGGLDFSIEPCGQYEKFRIKLNDYYTDDTFTRHSLNGTWRINNQKCEDEVAEISSLDSYIVSYEYNPELFFFVSCEPKYFYQDDSKIIFSQNSVSGTETEYSVELYPYITTSLTAKSNMKVEVNGELYGEYKKGQTANIEKLKFGDTIVVTNGRAEEITYDKDILSLRETDEKFGIYTFKVREQYGDFTFDPADYKFEHGTIEFRYLGNKITGKINLAAGRQIEYSALKTDEGYWLPEGDNVITVSEDAEETKKEIGNIRFYKKQLVTVNLPQPAVGGTIIYKKDDRTVVSQSEKMLSGTRITMTYKPWAGWKQKYSESSYIVSDEQETQTVNINGYDVNSVFEEAEDHKPNLIISANRNIGSEMKFSLHSSDTDISGLSWDRKNKYLYEGKTGTSEGITLSVSNAALPEDQMLKLVIEKTDKNKKKYHDIRYITSIPESEKIDIYTDSEIKSSDIYYTDICINVSLEEKMIYIAETPENAAVQITFADTDSKNILQENDYIDSDRMIELTLKPEKGYYLTGSGVINNVYQKTMKYSDYLLSFEKTDNSHPRKKVCTLTLDTEDKFGKVTYTLNGTSVSGVTEVREEDELIITYQLEDRNYIIYKDFISAMHDLLTKSPYERSEKIKITAEIDGTTIRREDYITVQKKEK